MAFALAGGPCDGVARAADRDVADFAHLNSAGWDTWDVKSEASFDNLSAADAQVLLRRLENLEQTCTHGGYPPGAERQTLDRRIARVGDEFARRLRDRGFETVDAPGPHWDQKSWKSQPEWLAALQARDERGRCDLLATAYGNAVARVSTLPTPAQVRVTGTTQIIYSAADFKTPEQKKTLELIVRDVERATWEFRYFLDPRVEGYAKACPEVWRQARARMAFIADSGRRPLGYAAEMCGRPMNAHYLDKFKQSPPAGWNFPSLADLDKIELGPAVPSTPVLAPANAAGAPGKK